MGILVRLRVLLMVTAVAGGLAGCGGGGGGAPAAASVVPVGPSAPTASLTAAPSATIDFTNKTTLQANADTFVAAAREAVHSLIKTGAMYGIFSMTTPWPTTTGTTLNCGADATSGSVTWNGSNFTGGTGTAQYSSCNASALVGPVRGAIALTYSSFNLNNPNDFVADMSTPGIDIWVSSNYAPAYMVPAGGTEAEFVFTGQYTFNATTHSPVYSVDTGTMFGSQRVIGQPSVVGSSGTTFSITDSPLSANFSPAQVLVRSNIDAKGNWVEMHFANWDVETTSGRPLPAQTCNRGGCLLDITDAKGNKASIRAVQGTAQTMVFTPVSGVAQTVTVSF